MQKPRFHPLRIADLRRETASAVSVAFDVPEALREDYAFEPGQYLTLRAEIDGQEQRRSYSICAGPDDGELRIAIKQLDGGLFSSWANTALHQGDVLDVMTPTGRFGRIAGGAPASGARPIYVAFAAGSGVTPILSIVSGLLHRDPAARVFVFYGNRSTADMLFRDRFEALKDRFMGRLSMFHVLSREEQDVPILNGRLDAGKITLLLRHMVPAATIDHAFVCGPDAMIDEITATLRSLGLGDGQIHAERFVSARGGAPRPAALPAAAEAIEPHARATLISDGKRTEVPVALGESLLDAALRAGLDLPFACKGGMCSTCRARLAEGAAEMTLNFSLEPWEIAAGFILTCQAHPTTPRVTVDFDQV